MSLAYIPSVLTVNLIAWLVAWFVSGNTDYLVIAFTPAILYLLVVESLYSVQEMRQALLEDEDQVETKDDLDNPRSR